MIKTKQTLVKAFGLLSAVLVGLSTASAQAASVPSGPWRGGDSGEISNVHSTVQIKTMSAANELRNQGALRGIDVSKYQGTIDWTQVAQDDVSFAMIRATNGMKLDPYFQTNAKNALANGIHVGAYHYATFHDKETAKEQAALFVNQLRQVQITYPVVLDIEANMYKQGSKSLVTSLAKTFMDAVRAEGYTVMLYSYNNFIRDYIDLGTLSDYELWVANYIEQPSTMSHKMWQHTSYGSVKGISGRVDLNIAYTDLATANIGNSTQKAPIRVNKNVSQSIKQTLNELYDANLPLEGVDPAQLNQAVATGLQSEINRQWGTSFQVNGDLTQAQVGHIAEVSFNSSTQGNITYLLQVKLFYKGHYTGSMTGQFDDDTVAAVAAFQQAKGIQPSGQLDSSTLNALLL